MNETKITSDVDSFVVVHFDRSMNDYVFQNSLEEEHVGSEILIKSQETEEVKVECIHPSKMEKKKKRWHPLCEEFIGFKMSLFPRKMKSETESLNMCEKCSIGYTQNRFCSSCHIENKGNGIESKCSKTYEDGIEDDMVRKKRKLKYEKTHKAVKYIHSSKQPIRNRAKRHDVVYYIHHRVYKKSKIDCRDSLKKPRLKSKGYAGEELRTWKIHNRTQGKTGVLLDKLTNRYILNNKNGDRKLNKFVLTDLMQIQDREITPEDYEILLHLDERVAKKTVKIGTLNLLKKEVIEELITFETCSICQESYGLGQFKKALLCGHEFHDYCIDKWLSTASTKCPIDGLQVDL